jgi:DNA-binding transcriptional LysR family regulator
MLTIRQLRYLDALARCQHFGRAAEECAVSQPALSMQIRELEEFLGIELFERRPGAPILTGVGIEIAQRAGAILSATRDLVDLAQHRSKLLTARRHSDAGALPVAACSATAAARSSGPEPRSIGNANQDIARRVGTRHARRITDGASG